MKKEHFYDNFLPINPKSTLTPSFINGQEHLSELIIALTAISDLSLSNIHVSSSQHQQYHPPISDMLASFIIPSHTHSHV